MTPSEKKKISLKRLGKSLQRILRSITPPVLQKLLTRNQAGETSPSAAPQSATQIEFQLPVKHPENIWPGFGETEITLTPAVLRNHLWAMPENELLILATICRILQPGKIFEFGTFTGASTLAMALNTPEPTRITTLDIAPDSRADHTTGMGNNIPFDFEIGEAFIRSGYESRIRQLHGNSMDWEVPNDEKFDLIFIDADHTYEFARNDTQKALQMLAPDGVILWHDYRWDDDAPECAGVTRFLNEFSASREGCFEIMGSRFAIFLSDSGAASEGTPVQNPVRSGSRALESQAA